MAEQTHLSDCGLRGEFRFNEPMSRHTSWRAGGPADRVYIPADLQDLAAFLKSLPGDEPVHMVGLGSNLLVRDGGLRGTVVFTHGALKQLRLAAAWEEKPRPLTPHLPHPAVYAEAGVAGAKVARFVAMHDLQGAEFLAGIPGTIGGALAMNAGCYGSETWDIVAKVQTIDRTGHIRQHLPADYEIAYRHVALKDEGRRRKDEGDENIHPSSFILPPSEEWFVAAWLSLSRGNGEISRQRIKTLLTKRIATQPLKLPNAGSVFRNPPGNYAARLIESCGLKGLRIGGAMVSPKHANFIVNTGSATAADIERVIETVQKTVLRLTDVKLEQEVRIIGEH